MDSCDLLDAADIASEIPASFFTQLESKKWSDRKEALEIVEKATLVPKIQNADFTDLVRALKKTVAKDSNIVVVTLAAKCLCQLAQGLRSNFSPYADSCLTVLFEKFKEKKPNVISVIREATDAAFLGTNLENIFEDIIQFLDNKNPQIKSEMALFLARTFSNFSPQVRNKKTLRPLINALMKTLSDMDATVRDNSAMAIGTAMKVIGENSLMPLIADVEPIKISKIKEFCEKAEIKSLPVNGQNHAITTEAVSGQQNAPVVQTNGVADDCEDDEDQLYEMLDAVDISSQISANFYSQMESKKWSDRKEALELIEKATSVPKIQNTDFSELVRVLKKTIAKDSNIVVVASAAKCLFQLAQGLRTNFAPHANSCLPVYFEKFKEKKPNVISVLRDAADAAFVATNLENILEDVTLFLDNKNPQIKSEMTLFLARNFAKFPAQVLNKKTLRPLINSLIKTLSDMDATVRDNSALAIGTAMKVTGEKLMMTLIADVEPIKIPKIKEFCEKVQVKKIPRSVLHAMNTAAPVLSTTSNTQAPQAVKSSSATMVRSTASRKLPPKVGVKSAISTPGTNATVKRTATIIKRSTVNKRASGLPQQHPVAPVSVPVIAPPAPIVSAPTPVIIAPTQHVFTAPQQQTLTSTPAKPVYATTQGCVKTPKQENFDLIIFRLISDNPDEVLESLMEVENSLTEDSEHTIKDRINQIIDLTCLQLIRSINSQRAGAGNPQIVERVADCLTKLFACRKLVSATSRESVRFLLVQIFTMTQACVNLNQDEFTVKTLNNLASSIVDGFEPSDIMRILTGLLNDPAPASIVEPIKKAIIRSMRSFK